MVITKVCHYEMFRLLGQSEKWAKFMKVKLNVIIIIKQFIFKI